LGNRKVTISIVGHDHDVEIRHFLSDLSAFAQTSVKKVVVTLNLPTSTLPRWIEARKWPFHLELIRNHSPLGFGANHNQAFEKCETEYFCVVNPDIRLPYDPFEELISEFTDRNVGCVYPLHLNGDQIPRDHSREIPSPGKLIKRYLVPGHRKRTSGADWVNAAFMLFPARIYRMTGGFDTSFFMYCEDVEICLRLSLQGYRIKVCQKTVVEHEAKHASRRKIGHLYWHLRSLMKLWKSDIYRQYCSKRNSRPHETGEPAIVVDRTPLGSVE